MDVPTEVVVRPATSASQIRLTRRTEWVLRIVMLILGPVLLLVLLEVVAFFWEKQQANGPYAWELVASRRIEQVKYHEPGAGYTLMKPGAHYEWKGIPVDINSHGLRGPETNYEKPPGTFRILNLGDSVAMGSRSWSNRFGCRARRVQAALSALVQCSSTGWCAAGGCRG